MPVIGAYRCQRGLDILACVGNDGRAGVLLAKKLRRKSSKEAVLRSFADDELRQQPCQRAFIVVVLTPAQRAPCRSSARKTQSSVAVSTKAPVARAASCENSAADCVKIIAHIGCIIKAGACSQQHPNIFVEPFVHPKQRRPFRALVVRFGYSSAGRRDFPLQECDSHGPEAASGIFEFRPFFPARRRRPRCRLSPRVQARRMAGLDSATPGGASSANDESQTSLDPR